MSDITLPGVGGVSRKALVIGGAASAAVIGFIWLRKKNSTAAATITTDPNADPNAANAGSDYVDPGLQDTSVGPTYGSSGYYDPNSGQWIYGNTGTPLGQATTNSAWAQEVEQYLVTNNGADPAALSSAIGKYLTGQAVSTTEESLIEQAIAIGGYPPQGGLNGYPPGIRTQPSTGQGGGSTGGTGGSTGDTGGSTGGSSTGGSTGSTGGSTGHPPATPSGVRTSNVTRSGFRADWSGVSGATSYVVRVTYQGKLVAHETVSATHANVSGLTPNHTYTFHVAAANSNGISPETNGPVVHTPR